MSDNSKEEICKKSRYQINKIFKVVVPITAVVTTTVIYTLLKSKLGGIQAKQISDITTDMVSGLSDSSKKADIMRKTFQEDFIRWEEGNNKGQINRKNDGKPWGCQ